MNHYNQYKLQALFLFIISLVFSTPNHAWINERGNTHYHQEDIRVYNPGYYDYYDSGRYYNPGVNIIVPNVIINTLPTTRYYRPICEEVEVCNPYRECWLEQYCN